MTRLITNIQRYGIHDGPGIRTCVFVKGCPLRCGWCHNPETQNYEAEAGFGREYSAGELAEIASRDAAFYESSGGGVTVSGGEPLALDMLFVGELLARLKRLGFHTAVDTCGHAPWENIEAAASFTDLFLYDLKAVNSGRHKELTGAGNELILSNLVKLAKTAEVWLRVPVIGGANEAGQLEMAEWAAENVKAKKVSLLPYHNLGAHKWEKLGRKPPETVFFTPDEGRMSEVKEIWERMGFDAEIGG